MDDSPRTAHVLAGELQAYAAMLRLRRFEEKAGLLYALGTLGTPCPVGIGQEGALVAIAAALERGDALIAMPATPALEVALGVACADVFRALVPVAETAARPPVLSWVPGRGVQRSASAAEALEGISAPGVLYVLLDARADGAGLLEAVAASSKGAGQRVVPLLVTPRDVRPKPGSLPKGVGVREVDGSDLAPVVAAIGAARAGGPAGEAPPVLLILTPPYVGHVRTAGAKAPARQDAPDPLQISRRRLLASGAASEAEVRRLEAGIRDEIVAAARLLTPECED